MLRWWIFGAAILLLPFTAAGAEEYLLRLTTRGFVDQPASLGEPKEEVLRSLELLVRVDSKFLVQSVAGDEMVRMDGELTKEEDGKFRVKIGYARVPQVAKVSEAGAREREESLERNVFHTSVGMQLDAPVTVSSVTASRTGTKREVLNSLERYVLMLKKVEPATPR